MPTKEKHDPGAFSWIELATTDADAAKKFYGGLFGWTFEDNAVGPDMTYTMNKLGNHYASALFKMGKEMTAMGIPPAWLSYVTVESADDAVKKAKAAGGKAMKEAFDVMDVGRMAVLQDPTGATFAVWEPKKHIGAGIVNEPGALTWNELYTNDVDAAGKFYVSVFGWKTQAMDMGAMGTYTMFSGDGTKATNRAGMMTLPPNMKSAPPSWLAYFQVQDCDASTKKAQDLGGKVLAPPTDIPGNVGRFAILQDPQGAVFAVFKMSHG